MIHISVCGDNFLSMKHLLSVSALFQIVDFKSTYNKALLINQRQLSLFFFAYQNTNKTPHYIKVLLGVRAFSSTICSDRDKNISAFEIVFKKSNHSRLDIIEF